MENNFIILSRVKYLPAFFAMDEEQKDTFHGKVAQVMGKYGLSLLDRYELITKPSEVVNIFETSSIDFIHELKKDLSAINYHLYIDGNWDIGIKT